MVTKILGVVNSGPMAWEAIDDSACEEKVVNLSAEQQQQLWTKYSALVLDDPSFPQVADIQPSQDPIPPESQLATSPPYYSPLTVDHLIDSTAFARQGDSPKLKSMPKSSEFKPPVDSTVSPV